MELVVRKTDLLRELQLFQGIVERKNTIPILANVLLEANGTEVKMLATDLEVGRQHPHFIALRFEQHVRENRNRVLALDDALEKLQFSQKVILPDNEFHRRSRNLERKRKAAVNGLPRAGTALK